MQNYDTYPSPLDEKDWIAESIYLMRRKRDGEIDLPKELDLRKDLQPIRSQGGQGTCSAQTASCMKEWQEKKNINLNEYFSPQFIYNLRENYPNSGMYGRNTMQILQKIGCCREIHYPYETDKDKNTVSDKAKEYASNYKIKSYAQVKTIDGLKMALYKNGPCYISFPTYNNTTTFWKPENNSQKMNGGHAVTVVGYNKEGFIIRNSWGMKWNNNGYTIYPYTQFGSHWEIWTTIDDESNKDVPNRRIGTLYKFYTCCKENI